VILLAFLFPLAIYLVFLARLNLRSRACVVHGSWDFAGILFAASGFLLFGGPSILGSLNERWRVFWMTGENPADYDPNRFFGVIVFLIYFTVVVAGAAFLLWHSRWLTSIYNVDPDVCTELLCDVLDRLEVPWQRSERQFFLRSVRPGTPSRRQFAQTILLEVEASPRTCHVTLRWDPPESSVRRTIEKELQRVLADVPAPRNPAGDWLLVGASLLFLIQAVGIGLLALFLYLRR
jgi:hypothetical protein